jgi:AraC-like DNA-binding protein
MSLRFYFCFVLILINLNSLFGQEHLIQLSYQQLEDSIEMNDYSIKYIEILKKKALKDKDTFRLAESLYYKYMSIEDEASLIIPDSIISLTKDLNSSTYPALGYMLKGTSYYDLGQEELAFENLMIAYEYAVNRKNTYQQLYIKSTIGTIKINIGQYKEAIKTFQDQYYLIKSQPNYKNDYAEEYITIIGKLSNAYLRGKVLDSAHFYIKKGLSFSKKIEDEAEYIDFLSDYANYLYFSNEYNQALDSFKRLEPLRKGDINLAINYYYQGKIHQIKNDTTKSIDYFIRIDSLYNKNQVPFLEHKEVYKTLYDHYFEQNNKEKQLYAINQFSKIDSILDKLSYNINSKSTNDYDIPKLKEEKEKLLKELNEEHNKTNYILIIAILLSLIFISILIKLYTDKKKLKSRFESIVQKQDTNSNSTEDKDFKTPSKETQNQLNISQEVIDSILQVLAQFENNKDYLDNQITLASLAKQFNTNSVYLSKVINHYKGMSFSNYLSNLRIKYCITELRENSTLRNYTIKAIAQEIGFRNSESFSKAFKKETGLNPSYYIKELNKLYDNKVNA